MGRCGARAERARVPTHRADAAEVAVEGYVGLCASASPASSAHAAPRFVHTRDGVQFEWTHKTTAVAYERSPMMGCALTGWSAQLLALFLATEGAGASRAFVGCARRTQRSVAVGCHVRAAGGSRRCGGAPHPRPSDRTSSYATCSARSSFSAFARQNCEWNHARRRRSLCTILVAPVRDARAHARRGRRRQVLPRSADRRAGAGDVAARVACSPPFDDRSDVDAFR